jgi:hypothetical protein
MARTLEKRLGQGKRACVVLALLLCAAPSRATECAPMFGATPSLATVDAEVRLQFLQRELRHAARRARIWAWGWGGFYSAVTVVSLAVTPAVSSDDRVDYYVSAGAAFIGVAALTVMPLKVMSDQRWLDRRIARAGPTTDRCALVADAERLLLRDAASEELGIGPLTHAGTFAVNVGVGLLLGLAFDHWQQAGIQMLSGIAVGEFMIMTQPTGSVDALMRYRRGALGPSRPGPALPSIGIAPLVGEGRAGLLVGAAF